MLFKVIFGFELEYFIPYIVDKIFELRDGAK